MTSQRGRRATMLGVLLAGLVAAATLASLAHGAPAQPQSPVQGAARIFVADDPDPRPIGAPVGKQRGALLRSVTRSDRVSVVDASQAIDVYALSTRPRDRVGSRHETLQEYRLRQLASVKRSETTSVWPETAPPREDSRFIKDGFIAFMGTTRGARVQLPGADVHGAFLLAPSGRIFEFVDYRVEEPPTTSTPPEYDYESKTVTVTAHADENETETERKTVVFHTPDGETITRTVRATASDGETVTVTRTVTVIVDGRRTRKTYDLTDQSVTRMVSLGGEQWSQRTTPRTSSRVARQIQFTNASIAGAGLTRLRLTATIRATVTRYHHIYDYNPVTNDWSLERIIPTPLDDTLTVHDTRPAAVVPTDSVSIRQRVIQDEADRKMLVITIRGPTELSRRQLWSWGELTTNQTLANVWGVYGVRQYHRGYATSNRDSRPREIGFPPTLMLRLTARQPAPGISFHGKQFQPELARVTHTRQRRVPGTYRAASLPDRVNLSTAPPNETTQLVIRNAPARVQVLTDVFGTRIPVTTTVARSRDSRLTYSRVDASSQNDDTGSHDLIRLRLTSVTGEPLADRVLHLDGAVRDTARTDDSGMVVIQMSEPALTATFRGDSLTDSRTVYYEPSHVTIVTTSTGKILPTLADILRNWRLLIIPAILALVLGVWRFAGIRW